MIPAVPPLPQAPEAAASTPRPSRFGRFAWWLSLFALVALPLGWGFTHLLSRFEEDWREARREELLIRADHLLATIERRLSPLALVQKALQLFQRRFREDRLDPPTLARLERRFIRRFPATATRFWFDTEGRLLQPAGGRPISGTRVWQALFRYLDQDTVSPSERLLAENLIRNTLGTMIDRDMLREGFRTTIEAVFNGQPNYFRILEIRDRSDRRVGALLLFIPRSHLAKGWELHSAMRSLGDGEQMIGGFWQSREAGRGTGLLTSNILHGLFSALSAGQATVEHAGTLYRSRLFPSDPDFMMTVGVRDTRRQDLLLPQFLFLIRIMTWTGLLVAGMFCLLLGLGRLEIDPPLQRKFLFGTVFLALPPLVALILLGWIQSEIMRRNTRLDHQRVLESELYRIEQAFADHIDSLAKRVRTILTDPRLVAGKDEQAVHDTLSPFRREGMIRFSFAHTKGLRVTHGFKQREARHRKIEDAVLNRFLQGSGMSVEGATATDTDASGLGMIFGDKDNRQLWYGMEGTFGLFSFGPMSWYVFNGFVQDQAGSQAAYLFFGFDVPRVTSAFLRKPLSREDRHGRFEFHSTRTPPSSPELRDLLRSAATRQSPVFSSFIDPGGRSVALARPLRGLDICGIIRLRVPDEPAAGPTQRFSLLIILTAAAAALLAAGLLRRKFLEPIQALAGCVERLDQGDFRAIAHPGDPDELGTLSTAFNRLADGLRQKSAMTAFVRPDLASEALHRPPGQVARRKVTILFAGLRRFSELEQTLAPRVALALMSRFLGICDTACRTNNGMIDKFIGDSAMGVFLDSPDDAVAAAIALRRAAADLMAERARRDLPTLSFGVGIASGEAVTGDIGSRRKRLDFTVIGDTVNLAARLEKQAGHPGGPSILAVGDFSSPPPGYRWIDAAIDSVRGRKGTLAIKALIEEVTHG